MKNGYKISWTDNALAELGETYDYLEKNWSERELRNLSLEIERTIALIAQNPKMFQVSEKKAIRRVVIKKHNTLYYQENERMKEVKILSFFSNRQSGNKLKL